MMALMDRLTAREEARLKELNAQIEEIERTPWDDTPEDVQELHAELCREKFSISPPAALAMFGL